MNGYIEYLENIKLFNLIITLKEGKLIEEFNLLNNELKISLNDSREVTLKFDDFQIDNNSFVNTKKNVVTNNYNSESIFKFRVKNAINFTENIRTTSNKNRSNLKELYCHNCQLKILKLSENGFTVLSMPENEMSELADNFFCHLDSNCHGGHSHNTDHLLLDSLNPLITKNEQTLRKSILESQTLFITNRNHLNLDNITLNKTNSNLNCICGYVIGYKTKINPFDLFLWKSNLLNEMQTNREVNTMLDLLKSLTIGRYLLETKSKPSKYIYIYVLNHNFAYQHFKCETITRLNLNYFSDSKFKKIIYNITSDQLDSFESLKSIQNDFNVNSFIISDQHFDYLSNFLKDSTDKLPSSMKIAQNNFYFALI